MSRIGGFIIGLRGCEITHDEIAWLQHPLVVGVILFTRNYQDKEQLTKLTQSIRSVNTELLISVDHEGGRVQRFRAGFTRLPAMNALQDQYDQNPNDALLTAFSYGETIAQELKSVGVDFSYAPVCDINYGNNEVIGDRAFHSDADAVSQLTNSFYQGLRAKNSIGVAKHFPGHGYVAIDTHLGIAYDDRSLVEIEKNDLLPFRNLIQSGIEAIMPAHIIYTDFDAEYSAVSSKKWMHYLRYDLKFQGLIISDDLDMKGADHLGNVIGKAQQCFDSGVDLLLCCNDFEAIEQVLTAFKHYSLDLAVEERLAVVRAKLR